ncbi:hypothetical protein ACGFZK_31830 [Streptomyces sp. NPDC048257]|uniref:hypothetical protein n=1 Tax=Streptomyces sp. NPDC048257 TaxID=3365526 RepID=UPI003724A6F4
MIVGGPPEFLGTEGTDQPVDVEALLGVAGSLLVPAAVLWAWTVYLDGSAPVEQYPSRIDSAAWAAGEKRRRQDEADQADVDEEADAG